MPDPTANGITVTRHAERRALTRIMHREDGRASARARIESDVDAALEAGRWSRKPPRWFRDAGGQRRALAGSWFAWSENREALFVMRDLDDGRRVVVTVVERSMSNNRPKWRAR